MNLKTILLSSLTVLFTVLAKAQAPIPELLYYRFNGNGTIVPNEASSVTSTTDTAYVIGGLTQGPAGQCGNALIGNGLGSFDHYVNTGWQTNLTGTSWTLSFWTNNVPYTTTTCYILGDINAGQFRVFTGGVAGEGNWILRGAFTDVWANGGAASGPTLTTFVYDMPNNEIRSYVNGVLSSTVAQALVAITGTGPFKVGGYATSNNLPSGSFMDEFRLYNRALSEAEIQSLLISGTSNSFSVTKCGSYTVPSNDETYTTSGIYTDTISNVNGCDSILTIDLTILPLSYDTISPTVCYQYTSPSGLYNWTASGTYTDTLTNAVGCDSIITINLTINQSTHDTITEFACGSYTAPDGSVLSASGVYNVMIPNSNGCDSLININLTVAQPTTSSITETVCNSYIAPDGSVYTSTGTYTATIMNASGCDSLISIDLTVGHANMSSITETACNSYTAPDGSVYTSTGIHTVTIINTNGCDSTITINLTVEQMDTTVSYSGVTLTANQSGVTYQWIDCSTMNPISGATSQSFSPLSNGSYLVNLEGTICDMNSDCHTVSNLGLDEFSQLSLIVFPNPVSDELSILNKSGEKLILELYDNAGKLLQTIITSDSESASIIKMQHMAVGIYQLRAKSETVERTFKIVHN